MFGSPDPKKIEQMMKKFNIKIRDLDAEVVVIKCKDRNIVISSPKVSIQEVAGNDIYFVQGEVSESIPANEDDVRMVMDKTGKDRKTVVKKLEELDNDLARAIMELKEK